LLRDIYDDLIRGLMDLSSAENIFVSQPCRDNTLYLLRLVDEMLISEIEHKLPVYSFQDFTTGLLLDEFLLALLSHIICIVESYYLQLIFA
jgi:small ligand-binding sensory domain FIST